MSKNIKIPKNLRKSQNNPKTSIKTPTNWRMSKICQKKSKNLKKCQKIQKNFFFLCQKEKNAIILVLPRGTRYCWAWGKDSFETNKWTMFLETEASFPYCNWSIKIARIVGFGSTSVVNSWQRLGLPFWVYVKVGYLFKPKYILKLPSKRKISAKKNQKRLLLVWFASVFAPSSAVFCFPWGD